MFSIKDIVEEYRERKEKYMDGNAKKLPISERHELISKFSNKINENRERDGLKKLPAKFFNVKMTNAGLKTNGDLYWFYAYCNETKNFDKTFWWSLKAK